MTISRDDINFEGNVARRLFWERCASRTPTYGEMTGYESPDDLAEWADQMLIEWDKRWIEKEKDNVK